MGRKKNRKSFVRKQKSIDSNLDMKLEHLIIIIMQSCHKILRYSQSNVEI